MSTNKNKKSFSLTEIMISILVLVVGISGGIAVLNGIVNNFRLATDTFIADNLAVEGIEIVRNIRDSNLTAGRAWNHGLAVGNYQADFNDLSLIGHTDGVLNRNAFFEHATGISTPFRRRIEIISCGVECLEIRSIITWVSFVETERIIAAIKLFRH